MSLGRNAQYLPPMGIGQPGATVQGGGGSGMPLAFRDPVDAARCMLGQRVPSAEYPDGYLGTINTRRSDRLLDSLKNNLNQRGYQRGVHKGERIEPTDYFWPKEFGPEMGLARQAAAVLDESSGARLFMVERQQVRGTLQERLTVLGERLPRGSESLTLDQRAVANIDRLRPAWS